MSGHESIEEVGATNFSEVLIYVKPIRVTAISGVSHHIRTSDVYGMYTTCLEIENEYICSRWVKDIPQHLVVSTYVKEWTEISCKAREIFDVELDIPYKENEQCKLDVYRNKETSAHAPVLIFIHGGYWQECSKDVYAPPVYPAMMLKAIAVMVGYQLAPKASLDEIVSQIKSAVEFVAKRFSGSNIYLCGHSAGAHLAAVMMTQESWDDPTLPSRVKGFCLVSGIYDLTPLLKTSINIAVKMNEEDAKRNSPALLLKQTPSLIKCPVIIALGEFESPSFHNQSKNLLEILKTSGTDCSFVEVSQCNHFSIISRFSSPEFQLSKELCRLITE